MMTGYFTYSRNLPNIPFFPHMNIKFHDHDDVYCKEVERQTILRVKVDGEWKELLVRERNRISKTMLGESSDAIDTALQWMREGEINFTHFVEECRYNLSVQKDLPSCHTQIDEAERVRILREITML